MPNHSVFIPVTAIVLVIVRQTAGQPDRQPAYRANVNLVEVTFSVTDSKGGHVAGLTPDDVHIFEDGIPQKIAFFAEGNRPVGTRSDQEPVPGTSIFILFDTSNRMYKAFPYVHDAINDFIQRLDPADPVALYSFNRNLFRAVPLTRDHESARAGLYKVVAGDDTALFNSVLLTLRDAAAVSGRKAIVAFSNGRDNASVVSPYDVGSVAEDEGIPVYVISTSDRTRDRTLDAVESLTRRTGGKLYSVNNWHQQVSAFTSVRKDIANSYTASYYPAPNPNDGFRKIQVKVDTPAGNGYQVRARAGYQIRQRNGTLEKIASEPPENSH